MGIKSSVIETNPIKWKVQVDENKDKNNIVLLENLIGIIKKDYDDPVTNLVKEQLKKESAIAMNFKCKLTKHEDIYSVARFYTIIDISTWHKHCDSKGSQYDFEFIDYVRLFNSDIETNLNFKSDCKCLLSNKQMLLYVHLIDNIGSTITR